MGKVREQSQGVVQRENRRRAQDDFDENRLQREIHLHEKELINRAPYRFEKEGLHRCFRQQN